MADESANAPGEPPTGDSGEIEKIDAEARKIEAEAERTEAEAKLAKAKTPLVDKLIMRGLVPIALAIVGPWALLTFSADQQETKEEVVEIGKAQVEQSKIVASLQKILDDEKKAQGEKDKRATGRRERMKKLEERKAVEITALSTMIIKLDEAIKITMLQMAMERVINSTTSSLPKGMERADKMNILLKARGDIVQRSMQQMHWPNRDPAEAREMAEQVFEKIVRDRAKKK